MYLGSSKRTLKNGYRFVSVGFAKPTLKDLDLLKFLNNTWKLLSLGLLVIENLYYDSFELVSCLHYTVTVLNFLGLGLTALKSTV